MVNFRQFLQGLRIVPKSTSTADTQGELESSTVNGKLNYHNGTTLSPVVTESHTATLTNKTIDGDDNTVQDLALTTLKTDLPNANKIIQRDAAGVVVNGPSIPTGGSGAVVTTDGTQTLTNKTIDGDDNTVQDLPLTSIKTALGQANRFISRDAAGVPVDTIATPTGAVVGTTDTQTLTNKTIDATSNTLSNIQNTSLATVIGDANKFLVRDGTGAVVSNTKDVPTGVVVGTTDTQTLTNKTIDGDDNTVQDLALTSLKTNLTDASKFLNRDASGVVISSDKAIPTGVVVGTTDTQTLTNKTLTSPVVNTATADTITGITTLSLSTTSNQNINLSPNGTGIVDVSGDVRVRETLRTDQAVNSAATGANVDLSVPGTSYITFTNASLTSIRSIAAGSNGQIVTIKNATSVSINILNESGGATAANRIITGTGADFTMANNSQITIIYDSNASRWSCINGVSVGGSGPTYVPWASDTTNLSTNEFGTPTGYTCYRQRIGDTLYVRGYFKSGTTTGNPGGISFSGLTIDTTKISTTASTMKVGLGAKLRSGSTALFSSNDSLMVFFDGTNTDRVFFTNMSVVNAYQKVATNSYAASGDGISFEFSVPIVGW